MTIDDLKSKISGRVIVPGDADYDALRTVVPGYIDRKPAVIVRVVNDTDVATVINFARESGMPLAVRCGGHSAAGYGVVDDGIVLDVRDMHAVEVDANNQTAWVQAGATARQVTEELDKHNLVLGFGDTGSVGVGGITTGGGIGFLVRKFGLTIDNVLAAEVVTAEGKMLRVDEKNHPDLFWAIRGGGGNFGVVARFKFKLRPLEQAYGGMIILPATATVLAGATKAAVEAPEELSTILNVMPAPPMPFLPTELHGKLIVMVLMMYAGEPSEGETVVTRFRTLATPLADMVRPMRYKDIFFPDDESYHPLAAAKNMFMKHVDESMAQTIVDQLQKSDAAMRAIQLRPLGGAVERVSAEATAYAHRLNPLMVNVASFYTGPDDFAQRQAWVNETCQLLDQGEKGVYVNFLGDEGEERVRAAYPEATWKRLQQVKKEYDPTNLFRLNQNIKPE